MIALVQRGHDEDLLWRQTPRQLVARLHFSERVRRAEDARSLSLHALGSRGEAKDLKKHLGELTKDQP